MTALSPKDLRQHLDGGQMVDGYLTAHAATIAVNLIAGLSVGSALFAGFFIGIAAIFVLHLATAIFIGNGDPLALRPRILGSVLYTALLALVARENAGAGGLVVAILVFLYLVVAAVRRHNDMSTGAVALPAPTGGPGPIAVVPAQPPPDTIAKPVALPVPVAVVDTGPPPAPSSEHASLPGPVGVAYARLPSDTSAGLRARVDTALDHYRRLHDILSDPVLLMHTTVDASGLLAAAEQIALELLHEVPRLARLQAHAARRGTPEQAKAAAAAAFAGFDRSAEALAQAATNAFKIVAGSPVDEAAHMREHTDHLTSLRSVHDELQPR
jgi:hypothetical protein